MHASKFSEAIEQYILYRDLSAETAAWYRRIGSVFTGWAGRDVLLADFNGEQISRLLLAKREAGRSTHYVKSLRSGLVAMLREIRGDGPIERVRRVKTTPLDPQAWTPAEVERLLRACDVMPPASRWRWVLTITVAYYTGLDRCDLWRLERGDIGADGAIHFRRQKTGGAGHVRLPPGVVRLIAQHCPAKGPILHLGITPEWFRVIFAGIVKRAKLSGTFKKFRKTSGSLVEQASPGKGHKHLANTRAIFERHYESRGLTSEQPTMPPEIRLPPDRPAA